MGQIAKPGGGEGRDLLRYTDGTFRSRWHQWWHLVCLSLCAHPPPHHLPMKILIKTEKILLLFNNMDSRLWEKVYFIEVNHSLLPLLCIDPLWDYSFLQFPITRRKGLWQTRIGVHLCTPDWGVRREICETAAPWFVLLSMRCFSQREACIVISE